jgi:glucose/arabinose dehydrogenase
MVFLPDGRALIAQRRICDLSILEIASGILTPLTGGPLCVTEGDAGLHDVVLHPDFRTNHVVYVSFSTGTIERSTIAIARGLLQNDVLVGLTTIFTADAYADALQHYGGRLTFVDEYLFATIGDRHHDDRAQQLSNHAGKIVRLHDDGRTPNDNPFVDQKNAKPEIWSVGHRNPQGLSVHPDTHELWSHEHGPLAGDELNVVRRGGNYGWAAVSYGWQYLGGPIGRGIVRQAGMEDPLLVWTPAVAPSGLLFYSGDVYPEWRGSVFVGSLVRKALIRLVLRDGRVVLEERLLDGIAGRVRLVAQDARGNLFIGNDEGDLLRFKPQQ